MVRGQKRQPARGGLNNLGTSMPALPGNREPGRGLITEVPVRASARRLWRARLVGRCVFWWRAICAAKSLNR